LKILINSETKLHPVESFENHVEVLINDIITEGYDFSEDMREVMHMRLELSRTPEDAYGDISTQYADVQAYISRVTYIIMEILLIKSVWKNYLARATQVYTKARNYYFTHDVQIKSLRNKELQESAVQEKVPHLIALRDYCELIMSDIKDLIEILREKKEELDKINTNINRQQKIVEGLHNLGYPIGTRKNDKMIGVQNGSNQRPGITLTK
jgi:hypothetical protein